MQSTAAALNRLDVWLRSHFEQNLPAHRMLIEREIEK
jgi:hypothetical protein